MHSSLLVLHTDDHPDVLFSLTTVKTCNNASTQTEGCATHLNLNFAQRDASGSMMRLT
jgi:hypothetical protein